MSARQDQRRLGSHGVGKSEPDATPVRSFCADSTSWPAATFAFASRKRNAGSQGVAFTSCSRNSMASALCLVFSSRTAAGSRFSKGFSYNHHQTAQQVDCARMSPAAMRISARPRKFAASSLCSSISRVKRNSSTLRVDCLSPEADIRRRCS